MLEANFCNNLAFCESSKMLAVSDMTRSGRVTMYEVRGHFPWFRGCHSLTMPETSHDLGRMAFSDDRRRLFVINHTMKAVHAVHARRGCDDPDEYVVRAASVMFVGPIAVASQGALVAVIMMTYGTGVDIFCLDGATNTWMPLKAVLSSGVLSSTRPKALRFSRDGRVLAVADDDGLTLCRVADWTVQDRLASVCTDRLMLWTIGEHGTW